MVINDIVPKKQVHPIVLLIAMCGFALGSVALAQFMQTNQNYRYDLTIFKSGNQLCQTTTLNNVNLQPVFDDSSVILSSPSSQAVLGAQNSLSPTNCEEFPVGVGNLLCYKSSFDEKFGTGGGNYGPGDTTPITIRSNSSLSLVKATWPTNIFAGRSPINTESNSFVVGRYNPELNSNVQQMYVRYPGLSYIYSYLYKTSLSPIYYAMKDVAQQLIDEKKIADYICVLEPNELGPSKNVIYDAYTSVCPDTGPFLTTCGLSANGEVVADNNTACSIVPNSGTNSAGGLEGGDGNASHANSTGYLLASAYYSPTNNLEKNTIKYNLEHPDSPIKVRDYQLAGCVNDTGFSNSRVITISDKEVETICVNGTNYPLMVVTNTVVKAASDLYYCRIRKDYECVTSQIAMNVNISSPIGSATSASAKEAARVESDITLASLSNPTTIEQQYLDDSIVGDIREGDAPLKSVYLVIPGYGISVDGVTNETYGVVDITPIYTYIVRSQLENSPINAVDPNAAFEVLVKKWQQN